MPREMLQQLTGYGPEDAVRPIIFFMRQGSCWQLRSSG
jgi:hypothetical protein